MRHQEKPGGESRMMTGAGNLDTGKLVDPGPDQGTLTNKKRPVETTSPATGSETVSPKKGRVKSFAPPWRGVD